MLNFQNYIDREKGHEWIETDLSGQALLNTPLLNKGTAFSLEERKRLNLVGRLPDKVESIEEQIERVHFQYKRFSSDLQKHLFLHNLREKNEVLFYRLLCEDLSTFLPIIYTPVVGSAVKVFSQEFRHPRGLYVGPDDLDNLEEIFESRSNPDVDLIVVTDGEGVLGLGDQGIGGMGIPIAKLILYSICGVDPYRTLPIMLDMGTDNTSLQSDPMYLGIKAKRLRGPKFDAMIQRFVDTVHKKFPGAFLHWEDFGRENARRILKLHQHTHCMFNDDMQGTGVVTLAAFLSAINATHVPLQNQRVVVFGAGTAGIGIADQLCDAMVRKGLSKEVARKQFWLIDRDGLLMEDSSSLNEFQKPYARKREDLVKWENKDHLDLHCVVKEVQPTVLVGCSTVRGAFTQEIVRLMAQNVAQPIIFPLSNPTDNCEAKPEHLVQWTQGKALIATGSPFEPVDFNQKTISIAQCNNALSFPGIGLGVLATGATELNDNMLAAASQALSEQSPVNGDPNAPLLPSLKKVREIAFVIARAVAEQACQDKVATIIPTGSVNDLIQAILWKPFYRPIRPKR